MRLVVVFYNSTAAERKYWSEVGKTIPVTAVDNTQINLGYGAAANLGLRRVFLEGVSWGIVMNQDCRLSLGERKKFLIALDQLEACVAGPVAGRLDAKRWTTIISDYSTSTPEEPGYSQTLQPVIIQDDMSYISGECVAIHKDVFAKIGGFYEPYFMYYEDADYSIRARNARFPIIQLLKIRLIHAPNTSIGSNSFLHQYYLARNHLLFVSKLAPVSVKLYELFRLPKTFLEHLLRKENGGMRGVEDYIKRKFENIQ